MSKKSTAEEEWRNHLVQQLKSCAREIYYEADDIIGNMKHMTYPITLVVELTADGRSRFQVTWNGVWNTKKE